MTDLDQRVRQAFDEIAVPEDVKRSTLTYIVASASAQSSDSCPAGSERQAEEEASSFSAKRGGRRRARRALVALAACFALVAVGAGCFELYRQPTAYVGIDVNPSIELGLNRFGIVVEAEALNDDGRALLDAVSVTNLSYDDALAQLTESAAFAPYVEEGAFVEISVTASDEHQKEELCAKSDAHLESMPCKGSCHEVDEETRRAAADAGMGVGRYRAAVELMTLDPDTTLDECSDLTMRELRDRVDECSGKGKHQDGEGSGSDSQSGNGQGSGHGHKGKHGSGRHSSE